MKDYVLTLLVAAAVTYVLTPLVRRFAIAVGAIKQQPRERDVHTAPVPTVGGIAMYAGLAAALLVADEISQLHDDAIAGTGLLTGLLGAGGLLVIIGFIDDRWGMSALTKAVGQVAAGGILVATGAQLSWLPLPGGSGRIFIPSPDEETLLTILIVVATINAVNFIDGLDGLAAGIVAIAATSFFAYYYTLTKIVDISSLAAPALASAVLIGMCLGFLPHNFAPAKIFMGDTGAMLLGLLLAYAAISSINSLPPQQLEYSINRYPVIMPLLLPAVLLVIPYGDMLLAVVRRARAGQSPFAADRKHLHHRLLDIGHSQRASVLIMYLWAAAFSGSVVWLSIEKTNLPKAANHHGEPVLVFVAITAVAIAILVLLSMPWRRWAERARSGTAAGQSATAASPLPTAAAGHDAGLTAALARSGGSDEAELVGTAAPTRAAVLSARSSAPAQPSGLADARSADGGDGTGQAAPRATSAGYEAGRGDASGDGIATWPRVGNGAVGGEGAELWPGDAADARAEPDGPPPNGAQPQDTTDHTAGADGWCGNREVSGADARSGEFVRADRRPAAAGSAPPAAGDDWGWFQPASGSLPESGRRHDS